MTASTWGGGDQGRGRVGGCQRCSAGSGGGGRGGRVWAAVQPALRVRPAAKRPTVWLNALAGLARGGAPALGSRAAHLQAHGALRPLLLLGLNQLRACKGPAQGGGALASGSTGRLHLRSAHGARSGNNSGRHGGGVWGTARGPGNALELHAILTSISCSAACMGRAGGTPAGPLHVCRHPELAYINHRQRRSPGAPAGFPARRSLRRRRLQCWPLNPNPVGRSAQLADLLQPGCSVISWQRGSLHGRPSKLAKPCQSCACVVVAAACLLLSLPMSSAAHTTLSSCLLPTSGRPVWSGSAPLTWQGSPCAQLMLALRLNLVRVARRVARPVS